MGDLKEASGSDPWPAPPRESGNGVRRLESGSEALGLPPMAERSNCCCCCVVSGSTIDLLTGDPPSPLLIWYCRSRDASNDDSSKTEAVVVGFVRSHGDLARSGQEGMMENI